MIDRLVSALRKSMWLAATIPAIAWQPGCGAPPAKHAESAPAPAGVERWMPLRDKDIYTYETLSDDSGARDMFMVHVRRPDPHSAELVTGSRVRSLVITPEAIRRRQGGVLLQLPLEVGASWQGDNGGQTRVVSTSAAVDVPAGKFQGCVQTVEEIAAGARGRITTSYCPLVGIAQMIVEEEAEGAMVTQRVSLRSYGAPVDLGVR